ncbi:MAG: extracellular solute-binding protein [Chloroflexi bacterium]|nr:extracellular solute-binding protein [Chloroflexota bacterium]
MQMFGVKPLAIVAILLVFAVSCATPSSPAVTPAPALAVTPPSAPAPSSASSLSPEEAAWSRVVAAARKEGAMTLYSYTFVGDLGHTIKSAFERTSGIKVEIITGRGSEFVTRIRTEQRIGQVVADVMEDSTSHNGNAKLQGALASAKELPELRKRDIWAVSPLAADPDAHLVAYAPYFLSPYLNTKLVQPSEEPKSWADLLDPRWKGKMAINDPSISTGPYSVMLPVILSGALPADYAERLGRQDLRMVVSSRDGLEKLARGEVALNLVGSPFDAIEFVRAGAPMKALDMREGIVATVLVASLVKDSPHPNAARVFLNWLLSEEGQKAYSEAKGMGSMRKGMPDYSLPTMKLTPRNVVVSTLDYDAEVARYFREHTWNSALKGTTR